FTIGYAASAQASPPAYPWIPNTEYTYTGQLVYPHNQFTPNQTRSAFYTTPTTPGPISVGSITHCSALVTVQNAPTGTDPANPNYTSYQASLAGTGAPAALTQAISGTGLATDTTSFLFVGMQPNTSYTPSAKALNENAAWNNSA